MMQSMKSENDSQAINSSESLQKTAQINDQQLNMSQNQSMEENLNGTNSMDIPEFKCPLASCNYTTTSYRSLTIHAAIHSGTRQYKCPVEKCQFHALKRNKVLNHYAEVHSALAPISLNAIIPVEDIPPADDETICKYEGCKYHTKRASDMKYHLKVHTGVKDYECQYKNCHFSAYRLSDLSYHKKLYHNNESNNNTVNTVNTVSTVNTSVLQSTPQSISLSSQTNISIDTNENIANNNNNNNSITPSVVIVPIKRKRSHSNDNEINNNNNNNNNSNIPIPSSDDNNNYNNNNNNNNNENNNHNIKSESDINTITSLNQSNINNNNNNNNNPSIIPTPSPTSTSATRSTTTTSSISSPTSSSQSQSQSQSDEPQRKRICCIKQSCPINGCPLIFDSYNHMLQHLYVHTGEKLYKCSVPNCSFAGSRISSIREHAKSIHPTIASQVEVLKLSGPGQDAEGYYHCNECIEKFKNLIDYRVHLASHKGVYSCTYPGCSYSAIRKSLIQSHMIIHTNTTFSCEYPGCIYKTNNPRAYEKHKKTHQNEIITNNLFQLQPPTFTPATASNLSLANSTAASNNINTVNTSNTLSTSNTCMNNNSSSSCLSPPQPPPLLPPTLSSSLSSSITTSALNSSILNNNSNSSGGGIVNPILTTNLIKNPKDGLFHCIFDNCSYATIRKCNMKRHFNSHKSSTYSYTPKTEYKCPEPSCPFVTLCSSLYFSHLKEFHPHSDLTPENAKEICCSYPHCDFKTHTMKNLTRHKMRMHDEAKNYKCSESDCNKELKSKTELNMHLQNHRQKKLMGTSNNSS